MKFTMISFMLSYTRYHNVMISYVNNITCCRKSRPRSRVVLGGIAALTDSLQPAPLARTYSDPGCHHHDYAGAEEQGQGLGGKYKSFNKCSNKPAPEVA